MAEREPWRTSGGYPAWGGAEREATEEAPMSLVEREESTLAGRLGMARARYEGAVIAVHEAEVEGRDIHAQQPRRSRPNDGTVRVCSECYSPNLTDARHRVLSGDAEMVCLWPCGHAVEPRATDCWRCRVNANEEPF